LYFLYFVLCTFRVRSTTVQWHVRRYEKGRTDASTVRQTSPTDERDQKEPGRLPRTGRSQEQHTIPETDETNQTNNTTIVNPPTHSSSPGVRCLGSSAPLLAPVTSWPCLHGAETRSTPSDATHHRTNLTNIHSRGVHPVPLHSRGDPGERDKTIRTRIPRPHDPSRNSRS
jgi:hypothetical protein